MDFKQSAVNVVGERKVIQSKQSERERQRIAYCHKLAYYQQNNFESNRQVIPNGFGISKLSTDAFYHLKSLHHRILNNLSARVYWSSCPKDPRQRCYGLINGSKWENTTCLINQGINFSDEGIPVEDAKIIHQYTIDNCCVSMDLTEYEARSINELIVRTNEILESYNHVLKGYERSSVTLDNLVAIQPNLHNGADYLPLHLDCPLSDGFGVVIVTVAICEDADVVLVDEGDPPEIEVHNVKIKDGNEHIAIGRLEVKNNGEVISDVNAAIACDNTKTAISPVAEAPLVSTEIFDHQTRLLSLLESRIKCKGGSKRDSCGKVEVGRNSDYAKEVKLESNTLLISSVHKSDINHELSSADVFTSEVGIQEFPPAAKRGRRSVAVGASSLRTLALSSSEQDANVKTFDQLVAPNIAMSSSTSPTTSTRQPQCWSFSLKEGEMYVLSGDSRNKCAHGIIRQNGRKYFSNKCYRQSLNFRFGVHSAQQAWQEVDSHWSE